MSKVDFNKKIKDLNAKLVTQKANLDKAKDNAAKAKVQRVIDGINGEITKAKEALQKESVPTEKGLAKAKEELRIMDAYKVDELFVNSNGRYFTNKNFAELSEKDKTKVKTLTREIVSAQFK